jgi:hypothetical protein
MGKIDVMTYKYVIMNSNAQNNTASGNQLYFSEIPRIQYDRWEPIILVGSNARNNTTSGDQ